MKPWDKVTVLTAIYYGYELNILSGKYWFENKSRYGIYSDGSVKKIKDA